MKEFLVYSSICNGNGKVLFKKDFQGNPQNLPEVGLVVKPAHLLSNWQNSHLEQGTIMDVQVSKNSIRIWVETETSTNELRDILVPEGWQEVSEG
ncbi:MAG: hypothetical protein A2639_01805 [Candidatus Staskawiczbacteria bacterium RIFCSPHIGHO2_01_FULL_34_27]|uniref:Uncharacterized protein n=2 Tax=Candidatus Staskawicziibacteriota TaxID=1817916 RepID=A0A1G2HMI9_9BACT|nr:MAG: hypothetical protein A2639_01805 [Candidatus Staskawiczbacteria bacterium RIFCSPHIGHO2_01_FULL_34_27]OGZ69733.1 MAG: hypothetical protein A3D35_02075 [Candidatus Staskawiczbacteria bacterium RIFCSPHIGHO2_02_FULL_34_9]